jgi:NAD(P)H-nitrite reductase large subunit
MNTLCYCFEITEDEVIKEIRKTGKTAVIEKIKELIKKDGCDCKNKNPKGVCCLPDIKVWLEEQGINKSLDDTPKCSCCK